ncbi:hypothetical protein HGRIS_006757 [Hohenbuehelia grisea]|uniref:Acyl-CoA oxidase C-alpha1 domain-containing protein n=1 Tax=Hohenbuehelia grisea TaxID=104357 RepID=A0ABR3JA21_9AGAR
MSWPTIPLLSTPLFRPRHADIPLSESVSLTYQRTKAIVQAYGLTEDDVRETSPKFWFMHTDPIWTLDGGAGTLTTIQVNLCAGTLAMFSEGNPKAAEELRRVLRFDVVGQFCLTEAGHGLDVIHMETTATLLSDGSFDLHTPTEAAAKFMPPTAPAGVPCISVVFARTICDGEDRGVKPFLVPINDGIHMHPGVVCKLLPQRGSGFPVNHSLTYFDHVRLPSSALLGPIERPADPRTTFFANIFRVAVGTIAIGSQGMSALQMGAYIAAKYSARRTVISSSGERVPILEFRTQKIPILTALAQAHVMVALHHRIIEIFALPGLSNHIRHGIGSILKVVMMNHSRGALMELSERMGAQGLFEFNQISSMHSDLRGAAIAEGDCLVVSIRLATELLLGRYSMMPSSDPDSLLARHEIGRFAQCRALLKNMRGHRDPDFDRLILPQALSLVESIGHRIAYDAAVDAGLDQCIIDTYVASCIKLDPVWYSENAGLSQAEQRDMEARAIDAMYPRMWELLSATGVEPYIMAPAASEEKWARFRDSLVTFHGAMDTQFMARL